MIMIVHSPVLFFTEPRNYFQLNYPEHIFVYIFIFLNWLEFPGIQKFSYSYSAPSRMYAWMDKCVNIYDYKNPKM